MDVWNTTYKDYDNLGSKEAVFDLLNKGKNKIPYVHLYYNSFFIIWETFLFKLKSNIREVRLNEEDY